jgi:hypothetical protein
LQMKLKGLHFADVAKIQELWWIKEDPKEKFSAAFEKLYDHAKTCIYVNGAYFVLKKSCLPHVLDFSKKSALGLLERTV